MITFTLKGFSSNCDNYIVFFFSAIGTSHNSLFKKDQDILVLPLDLLKFDTQDVLKHFGKVWYCFVS